MSLELQNKPGAPPVADLRGRILDAAVALFAERGFGSVSVREVVERVGCTKPALYYHFGSKADLYLEAVHTRLHAVVEVLSEVVATPGPPQQRLERFARVMLDRAREQPEGVRLILTAEHHTPDDGTPSVDLLSLHMEMLELLGRIISDGQRTGAVRGDLPPFDLAVAFVGMLHVHTLATLYGIQPEADVPAQLIDIFFSGIQPRE